MSELHLQHTTKANPEKGRRAFLALTFLCATQLGAYGYLVNASVTHVVTRMELEKKTNEISSQVSVLEASYFDLQNNVTIETANNLHYTTSNHVQYVDATGASVVMLSRNN